jgi:aspartate beta-hydroxylase
MYNIRFVKGGIVVTGVLQIVQQAQDAYRRGDYIKAQSAYSCALNIDPENPGLLNSYGIVLTDLTDFEGAFVAFYKAIALDNKAPELWMNLAKAQRLANDEAGEAKSLAAALAIDQRHFMARVRQAELHERQHLKSRALYDWNAVVQLSAGLDNSDAGLANILSHAKNFVADCAIEFNSIITPAIEMAANGMSYEARRRFDAMVDIGAGKRTLYRNECAGVYYPFLPADEFFSRDHFEWMPKLEEHSAAIKTELVALLDNEEAGFAPYVSLPSGTPESKWSTLSDSDRWGACYLIKYGIINQTIADKCPQTMGALKHIPKFDIPGRGCTVFFSLLKPKSHIPPHTGVSNTRTIIHLPLIIPDKCGLRVGGETREWQFGTAFGFDDTIEHEAWNNSEEMRAVLIFDVWNPYLRHDERTLLSTFYTAADKTGLNSQPFHDI